jgi:asparagine synthase (glutamine-hydrolysing)
MLESVDRFVDLTGDRVTRDRNVVDATASGDVAGLSALPGHFAAVARRGRTVSLARTIGVPLRYFVAKMYHGPFLIVSERMDLIFEWCCAQRIAWQFDPSYTRMVPAHYVVELDQVGCPDPAPRYRRFFDPPVGTGPADLREAGAAYIAAAYAALREWIECVPDGRPIGVAFSGGVDSTAVLLLARTIMTDLGRDPTDLRALTLDLGNGADAAQAERVVRRLGIEQSWERITVPPDRFDLEDAIRVIEDYHPLDVECAAAGLCLMRAVRERYPEMTHLVDGDGGDENLKSYPLEDSDLTLSSVLSNPLLYHEGWGIDAIKHSLVYSGGLSRGYMRTWAPADVCGFHAFSPFTVRAVIARALEIPFAELVEGSAERLASLKQKVVGHGVEAVLGVRMPLTPKRRFQDGAGADVRQRASKAWCRRIFDRMWDERSRTADDVERRSGNEIPA